MRCASIVSPLARCVPGRCAAVRVCPSDPMRAEGAERRGTKDRGKLPHGPARQRDPCRGVGLERGQNATQHGYDRAQYPPPSVRLARARETRDMARFLQSTLSTPTRQWRVLQVGTRDLCASCSMPRGASVERLERACLTALENQSMIPQVASQGESIVRQPGASLSSTGPMGSTRPRERHAWSAGASPWGWCGAGSPSACTPSTSAHTGSSGAWARVCQVTTPSGGTWLCACYGR
jgi:hypothetical protein